MQEVDVLLEYLCPVRAFHVPALIEYEALCYGIVCSAYGALRLRTIVSKNMFPEHISNPLSHPMGNR